jgi:hypothetical protein
MRKRYLWNAILLEENPLKIKYTTSAKRALPTGILDASSTRLAELGMKAWFNRGVHLRCQTHNTRQDVAGLVSTNVTVFGMGDLSIFFLRTRVVPPAR